MVKKDAYERILTEEKTDSAKGPFVSFYRTGEKLLMELPPSSIGRDMLIGATISSVSSPQFAEVGTRAGSISHVRFVEKDSSIVMQAINSELLMPYQQAMRSRHRLRTIVILTSIASQSRQETRRLEVFSLMFLLSS